MVKALIIIDMVDSYSKDIYKSKDLVKNQLQLINAFKKNKLPIIFSIPGTKSKSDNPIMKYLWPTDYRKNPGKSEKDPHALISELSSFKDIKIIKKPEYSAFFKTDLEAYCKKKKITELYFCGVYSGICVHYSAVDAAYRRIWPYLVTDASATTNTFTHKKNCKRFSQAVGKITTTREILHSLS